MSRSDSLNHAIVHKNGKDVAKGYQTDKFVETLIGESGNVAAQGVSVAKKNLDAAMADFDKSRTVILSASDALHKQIEDSSRRAKDCVSKAKDLSAQMTDAMNKITKMLGPDFDKRLDQLDHLTTCMERLSTLNESGKLTGVLEALRK